MLVVDSEKTLESTTQLLSELGIEILDKDGNYRGINEVIDDLAYAWIEIDDDCKLNIFKRILITFPVYIKKNAEEIGMALKGVLEKLRT